MPARVFVSYSHDSDAHKARVRAFVARLRGEGHSVVYDEDVAKVGGPDEGWPRWCERQIVELRLCAGVLHRDVSRSVRGGAAGGRGPALSGRPDRSGSISTTTTRTGRSGRSCWRKATAPISRTRCGRILLFLPTNDRSYADLLGWLKAGTSPQLRRRRHDEPQPRGHSRIGRRPPMTFRATGRSEARVRAFQEHASRTRPTSDFAGAGAEQQRQDRP